MSPNLVLDIPFLVVFAGVVLSLRSVRKGLIGRPAPLEKASARRWVGVCIVLILVGPAVHGLLALGGRHAFPLDAKIGCWFLMPLLWFFFDWERTWERIVADGAERGFSVEGAALLLRLVSGVIVFTAYYWLFLAALGIEVK